MNDLISTAEKFPFVSIEHCREWIATVEDHFKNFPKMEEQVFHHFSRGVYAREMHMKAGELVVGKIQKHENLNILSKGEVTVVSVDGVMRLTAPFTYVATPGAKRVIIAHTDVVWTVIHGTHEKDVEKVEEEMIAKSYDEIPKEPLCLGS